MSMSMSMSKVLLLAAAMWVAVVVSGVARAQTAEQLDLFRNLTPEQQQAVLERLATQQGGGTPATSTPGTTRDRPATTGDRAAANQANDERRRITTRGLDEEQPVPVLRPEDTVLVEPVVAQNGKEPLDSTERERLAQLVDLVRNRNPYQLDRDARLSLPGFVPVPLGGLTELQAKQRLSAEPAFYGLEVKLTRLPLLRTGVEGLKTFGYDLFENTPSTFSPVTDVPVPADYVVGPGDEFNVQLFGSLNRSHRLVVNREGAIGFPELGPINVGGLTFSAARRAIEMRIGQQMIGVQVNVSMGDMRTIRVFVLGEARQTGSYTVSGLATMTTALFAAGGVNPIGSLRDIQLQRQGQLVRRLDLYDLLIRGDTSDDSRLLPGDVIFIPPVGSTVSIYGEVKRPAIYELRGEASVADLARMAGGLTPEADAARSSLTRVDADSRRVVLNVNLNQAAAGNQPLRNGDVLRVARLRPQLDAGVVLEGFVHRPGLFAWREGLRLTDVIGSVDELRPGADLRYILIRRESGADRRISLPSADLTAALAAPGSAADIKLAPRDRIIVFDLAPGRERIIQPLLEELRMQSDQARPTEVVRIGGSVRVPGEYPLEPGMRVSDALRAGGGLRPSAYVEGAELARYTVGAGGARQMQLINIDLASVRRGDATADLALQAYDNLLVHETPEWRDQESVTLRGEVRLPGTYVIRKGETLRELLERAGGLTALAFPEGSAFMRTDLRVLEQQQLDRLAERMRTDLAALSLQAANAGQASASQALQTGQSLLSQLQVSRATGRFTIDLPGLLAAPARSGKDIVLRDGDELVIPKQRQEVTVIGEVQNATSHQFLASLKRSDYLAMSGGTTRKADKRGIYVVRADGSAAVRNGSLFSRNYDTAIKPGDTIVVPLNTERMPLLPLWQAVTQILYNVAISIAAVKSF